ncbi:MAG: restriction endonuclease subunit S, partial [Candidatus Gastranaerophilales bacterium]|nr:restriction endonuclease subunit S [Candidatus Gastranaerophilales bacterium]
DVCIVERGSSPRPIKDFITTNNNGVNWIKIGDCSGKYVTNTAQKITQEGAKKSRYVKVGDFIISNSMSYGKPYILKIDGYIHDGWFVLRLNNDLVNTDYFYYLLSSNYIREQYDALATGAIVQNISSDLIKKVTFKLPPLQEQQRIVKILNEAFENIEKAKQNALQNLNNVKELFESYVEQIFHYDCENIVSTTFSQEFKIRSGDFLSAQNMNLNGGYDVYGGNGINGKHDTYNYSGENIIIGRVGEKCGNIHYVNDDIWVTDNAFVLIDTEHGFDKRFLYYLLTKLNLRQYATKSTHPVISGKSLKDVVVSFPDNTEIQQKIVAQLDELQEQTKRLEQIYEQKIKDLDELKQSILQKAFNGEL